MQSYSSRSMGFNAHFAQLGEALFNTAFDDIFQRNNAQHTRTFHHHQRRGSLTRNLIDFLINIGREVTTVSLNMATNGIDRTFTDSLAWCKMLSRINW